MRPAPLVQIDGSSALSGSTATVTAPGQLPLHRACNGALEVEGTGYATATCDLRVAATPPGVRILAGTLYCLRVS